MPIQDRVHEADGVAEFLRKYWLPDEERGLPGMVETESQVPLAAADDIESLARAIRSVDTRELFPPAPPSEVPKLEARTRELIRILSNACELVLDDDVEEPADEALANAKERAGDNTRATRIRYLLDLAAVAEEVKDRLIAIKSFQESWIAEAGEVARKLSSAGPVVPGKQADPNIDLRNRLVTLLDERVSKVRRAAHYVYHDHPEIVRLATSAYERKRRLEAKRRKRAQEKKGEEPA
jgi:hypothetical protein